MSWRFKPREFVGCPRSESGVRGVPARNPGCGVSPLRIRGVGCPRSESGVWGVPAWNPGRGVSPLGIRGVGCPRSESGVRGVPAQGSGRWLVKIKKQKSGKRKRACALRYAIEPIRKNFLCCCSRNRRPSRNFSNHVVASLKVRAQARALLLCVAVLAGCCPCNGLPCAKA